MTTGSPNATVDSVAYILDDRGVKLPVLGPEEYWEILCSCIERVRPHLRDLTLKSLSEYSAVWSIPGATMQLPRGLTLDTKCIFCHCPSFHNNTCIIISRNGVMFLQSSEHPIWPLDQARFTEQFKQSPQVTVRCVVDQFSSALYHQADALNRRIATVSRVANEFGGIGSRLPLL